jgi:hypothetical protein
LAREEIELNGEWQYQKVSDLTYPPPGAWQAMTVPGYLNGYNYEKAWLRKAFAFPSSMSGMRIKLVFGAVKYDSKVFVNGQLVGGHFSGYDPFELDITSAVRFGEGNELLVGLSDWTALFSGPVDFSNLQPGEDPRERAKNVILAPIGGRYELYGIWDGVSLRGVPDCSIEDVFVMTSVRQSQITVRVRLRNEGTEQKNGTLGNRVFDGQDVALTLPDANVTVEPGGTVDVDVETQWPNAHLWCPSDSHLYYLETTLTPGDGPADTVKTRFGFREFWCEGDSFYLNGTKIHLLATSTWPPDGPMRQEDIRRILQDIKAGNNVAFRFHTQPWEETWYDIADEVGILIVEEGAVWGNVLDYRLADPAFWSNFADHLRGVIRRDRNHPSVVIWSLENELLSGGAGSIYPATEAQLAYLGRLVKELDPTRPITYEADLDPGGEADIIGLHYPHEFPDYHLWPNTAYWMDEPIKLHHASLGTWEWNRQKPLYIGEFAWLALQPPGGYSILYGDEAYADTRSVHFKSMERVWRMHIEAYREYGVSGMCPWTLFGDPAASDGPLSLNPEKNRLYQVQKAAYHPNAVFVKEYDSRFFVGEIVQRSVSVYNDTMASGDFTLRWNTGGSVDTRTFSLQAGERRHETVTFRVPLAPGDFALRIELLQGRTALFSELKRYCAYPQPTLSVTGGTRLALYDTQGTTAAIFTQQGISCLPVADLRTASYDQFDVLVIGSNSLAEGAFQVGAESIAAQWEDFCDRGGWVVVLEQSLYPRWMPLAISPSNCSVNFGFPRAPVHPIVFGISADHLRWWRGDNLVTAGCLPKPSRGNFLVLIDVGAKTGLDKATMIEIPQGGGGYICSQMLLATKFASEPMAGTLLQRILDYCSTATHCLQRAAVVSEADSDSVRTLSRVGVLQWNLLGRLAEHDLAPYPVVVVTGAESAWSETRACLEKLLSYVEAGGRLLLHRPSDAFLAEAGPVLIPNLEPAPNTTVPILRNASGKAESSLTNYDLYWTDDPGSSDSPPTLSKSIADRVYRKRFDMTNCVTLEVEDMPVKMGGQSISGGWGLYGGGYVAQNIVVPQSGPYLFRVVACGTPALGQYPQMVLRIDKEFHDMVVVDSQIWNWKPYSLTADLTVGEHELSLAFTNDACAPPEDRNLFLDKVLYEPDTPAGSELFLTKPGALVRVDLGKGFILFDEIAWEKEQKNLDKADRYVSTILTELGATIKAPSGLRIEAEEMTPVGWYTVVANAIICFFSNGRLESSIDFTTSGTYSFAVAAYGSPCLGVWPQMELRIDGAKRDSVFVNTPFLKEFVLSATVAQGAHPVALAFVNDGWAPPEDRNLLVDQMTISMTDTTPPAITLLGANPMTLEVGTPYLEPGYTATDNYDGNITAGAVVSGSVNHAVVGSYILNYNVNDSSGNPAEEETRTVNVVDATPPVITLLGANPVTFSVGTAYVEPGYTATDNYDGDITTKVVVSGSVSYDILGTYTLRYNVRDWNGNPAVEKTRVVNVADTTPPVISLVGVDLTTLEVGTAYAEPGYTATDNYDGDITTKVVVTGSVDHTVSGTYTLRYNVSDSSGNPAVEKTRTVNCVPESPAWRTLYVDGSASESGDGTSWDRALKEIQEAVAKATDGDTVVVAEGTYVENVNFNGKNMILRSTDPFNADVVARTIIDGNKSGSVVTFAGTENETCVLSGFTIRNGEADYGGGICGRTGYARTHATIRENSIFQNRARGSGGGMAFCDGTIRNNVITGNSGAEWGGGLVYCDGAIQNNVISNNSAAVGGGLSFCGGTIRNCIIWGNTAPQGAQLSESCVLPGYCCIQGWSGGGAGNIASDPQFVDADGPDGDPATCGDNNYRPSTDSPCIDAGKNEGWMWWTLDPDGTPRILYGISSLTVDIGPYEFKPQRAIAPPVITLLGANPVTLEVGTSYAETGYTAIDNYNEDITTKVVVKGSVNHNILGTYILRYNVSDSSGNPAVEKTRVVNVVDTTPPVITLLGASPVALEVGTPYAEPGYAATDNYDKDITANVEVTYTPDHTVVGSYCVRYNVKDSSGNSAMVRARVVNVLDTTPPVITLFGPDAIPLELGTPYVEPGFAAVDNYDGVITQSVVVTGSVGHTVLGTYVLHYNVNDSSWNPAQERVRTIMVADTTAPVIALSGANTVALEVGTAYAEPGYTATDNYDGDITTRVAVTGSVNHAALGAYLLQYNVSDSSGNPAEQKTRTVNVIDTTPPVIVLLGDNPMTVELGTPYSEPGFTATDNYDADISGNLVVTGSVNHSVEGTYTLHYNVSDSSGNPAEEKTRIVNVVRTSPFEIAHILEAAPGTASLTWTSRPGAAYIVWSCLELETRLWIQEATVSSGGETTTWTDLDSVAPIKFYRIEMK